MLKRLLQTKFRYLWSRSYVRVFPDANINIDNSAKISESHITIGSQGNLEIAKDVKIINTLIFVKNGSVKIDNNALIGCEKSKTIIYVEDGDCIILNHCRIGDNKNDCEIKVEKGYLILGAFSKFGGSRIWIRFGGNLEIGEYTNINHGTEIRCDEKVSIGSFCQISYNIRIWDTNTHEMLTKQERRKRTTDYFPIYGKEISKPKTEPVYIGDDCWIGENCAILKGSNIGDECVIGFHTIITGKEIPAGKTALSKAEIRII